MAINSSYLPNGSVQTQTDAPGVGLSAGISPSYGLPNIPTLNPQYLDYLSQRKAAAADEQAAQRRQMLQMQMQAMQNEQRNTAEDRAGQNDLRAQAKADEAQQRDQIQTPWYTQQGAATRPVGLGAQMIPGMQADPRLLPPSMRPSQSVSSYAPSAQFNQQLAADDEQRFGNQVHQDRARTSTAEDPYRKLAQQQQNALYGR